MPTLNENPTLKDLQKYVKAICAERGWDKDSYLKKFLLFSEEIGELAKAMRNRTGLYAERGKKEFELEEEFADVLSYLVDLANCFDVDLEKAFREKEKINQGRKWA